MVYTCYMKRASTDPELLPLLIIFVVASITYVIYHLSTTIVHHHQVVHEDRRRQVAVDYVGFHFKAYRDPYCNGLNK